MAVLETNYDELDSKKIEISDDLVDILKTLSDYCDARTASYPNGCFNCPFYIPQTKCSCLIMKGGYDAPYNWAIYKENEGGDINA